MSHHRQGHKKNKISRKAFSFKDYDGTKDARIVLAWVSQLDDYFQDEDFSDKDMVKCASNHLTGSAALWWNATKREGHRPRTWHAFQRAFKRQFLPSHYKSKARRQWDLVRQNLGEDVQAYTDRFWNCLIQLQTIEHVSKKKLKRKFISSLLPHFGTEVDMFHPHSLAKAISLALHSEKKQNF